jgi:hypothetical protein
VWCVYMRGWCPSLYSSLARPLGDQVRWTHPHTAISTLITVSRRKWGQVGGTGGVATPLARVPGPAPLRPIFAWLPPGWAWILAPWWAWPNSGLKWPFSSSPSNTLSRKAYFLLCSACFRSYFCISDNSRVQLETRHYHMCMCVLLFIPSFLVECWR